MNPHPREEVVDEGRPLYLAAEAFDYERSKATGERKVIERVARGLDAVIINSTGLLGPYDFGPSWPVRGLLNVLHSRLPIIVNGGFDWVDVRDVVAGALAAEQKGRTGERYLLGGRWVSVQELTSLFAGAIGIAAPRMVLQMWVAKSAAAFGDIYGRLLGAPWVFTGEGLRALISWRRVSSARAAGELGFRPRPIEVTVNDTVGWLRANGVLDGRAMLPLTPRSQ